ncbi:MAG: histidinol-phosphate transaminase [Clostridia bacterium]|nr:histidinol-phosphate transaminase [Clostridia bacterium]
MSKFLRECYSSLVPYTPGEQLNDKKYIKLNTNESPYPPSPRVKEALSGEVIDNLKLYSDPELKVLKNAIAQHFDVESKNVFCGNGSDDVIAFSIMAFCGNGGELCCPDITYSFYPVYCDLFGVNLIQKPLKDDFTVDVNDYIGINKNIIIANPNAPTGLVLTVDEIEKIVASNPDNVVIIDEAYVDFCAETCVGLLEKYKNLIVTQTFSKSRSLAGLRLGFALASEELIEDLEKIKYSFNPYNINTLSVMAGAAAIADADYYRECNQKTVAIREKTKAMLIDCGFECLDSQSNFIFAKHNKIPAEQLYLSLKENGVLIRYFNKPRISDYVRITVGDDWQMEKLVELVSQIAKEF